MRDYTFDDYRSIIEEHIMDFIPDVDHKSITLYESMKYSLSWPPAISAGERWRNPFLTPAP